MKKAMKAAVACGMTAVLAACAITIGAVHAPEAQAAQFKEISTNGEVVKAGKYYFKSTSDYKLKVSTKKEGKYVKTPITNSGAFSNGKKVYYTSNGYLMRYSLKSKKAKRVKKFSKKTAWSVSAVYGKCVFLGRGFRDVGISTYAYNTKTHKLRKVINDNDIWTSSGKYVVMRPPATDLSAHPMSLYKVKGSKLVKVRNLASAGFNAAFVGKKLYYMSYTSSAMTKGTLYCCDRNGKNAKKIFTIAARQTGGGSKQILVSEYRSMSCRFGITSGGLYIYNYKTKQFTRVSW